MAHIFSDATGREWKVIIDHPMVERVRRKTAIDLSSVAGRRMPFAVDDFETMVDVLYAILEPQCVLRGLDESQFAAVLAAEKAFVFCAAVDALLRELTRMAPARLFGELTRRLNERSIT